MDKAMRTRGKAAAARIREWNVRILAARRARAAVEMAAESARAEMIAGIHGSSPKSPAWRVLMLGESGTPDIGVLVAANQLRPLSEADERRIGWVASEGVRIADLARPAWGVRRVFASQTTRSTSEDAVAALIEGAEGSRADDIEAALSALSRVPEVHGYLSRQVLEPSVGLASLLGHNQDDLRLYRRRDYEPHIAASKALEKALSGVESLRVGAVNAGNLLRYAEVHKLLSEMPIERLREATAGRINLGALTQAGLKTVQDVLDVSGRLERIPGIGPTSAVRAVGAAQSLWHTTLEDMPFRIDIKNRSQEAVAFLKAVSTWDLARRIAGDESRGDGPDVRTMLAMLSEWSGDHFVVCSGTNTAEAFPAAAEALRERASSLVRSAGKPASDVWQDFLARPADYFALISELGFNPEDESQSHADIPVEIIEAARRIELDVSHLTANLRGYQAFAARYTIAQEKVIIGDEMGLGKTVESIAVLAHLRAKGEHFFLVICPAAVVTNWVREVASKSKLTPHRLHGPDRDAALRSWVRHGGVGVTTFESLAWLNRAVDLDEVPFGCVVVDEAHYIKNPEAQRSARTWQILERSRRVILMTGTPMENRLDEFRILVFYVRPDLSILHAGMSARKFRRQVAPVYLRRNQEDVLQELPELVEVDEVLPLSLHDADRYRQAAIDSSFMGLRQAAMLEGRHSMKMQRLLAIVQEAAQDGRKVIVFSYFLAVLEEVARWVPGESFGILSGRVSPIDRQRMVDDFTKAKGGAVLISQIIAGGVGLNIQAASVIIICEPQIKPTTEWQAIARARRMGQLNSVQVHRLISEEGVDQRITQLLAEKARLFEAFARDSDIAQHAPEAYDVSEADLARDVVAAERERLLSKPTSPVRSDEDEELPVA